MRNGTLDLGTLCSNALPVSHRYSMINKAIGKLSKLKIYHFLILFINMMPSTLLIPAVCRTHVIYDFEMQGVKLTFFPDSHLAPKFFKVVANSKKVGRHFQRQTNFFLYAVSVLDRPYKIKLRKRSLTCYKVDTHLNPRRRPVIHRDACATFWKQI